MNKKYAKHMLSLFLVIVLVLSVSPMALAAADTVTRGEMVARVLDQAGYKDQAAAYAAKPSVFGDVAEGSTYEGYINLAYEKGIVRGVGGGKFSPNAKISQVEAATMVLRLAGVTENLFGAWPTGYSEMAKWSGLLSGVTAYAESAQANSAVVDAMLANYASVAAKPVIGISWKSPTQDYTAFKTVIVEAGGIPVEMPRVTVDAVEYDAEGKILPAYVDKNGMLLQQYADVVKSGDFSRSNVAAGAVGVDGMFFTGGEDVSPSLFATPVPAANEGEEINATRDISDYILMNYCIKNDIPTFAVCRGEQVMGIVAGCKFIQDIPNYYKAEDASYRDTHRMPVGVPNRTYARHDVEISKTESKWLYDIIGSTTLESVSSWHHQAIGSVKGTDITVVANTTANGVDIVEGIELQKQTFCLGVQFHPENDCKLALVDNKPEEAKCDVDTCMRFFETLVAYAADRPVIGISWKSDTQDYEGFKEVIRTAGGIPVELPKVTSTAVRYAKDGAVSTSYLEKSGMIKQQYADVIKSKDFSKSNVAEAVAFKDVDGLFFTGGEDVSPSLFATPQKEANEGEEINAARDISDYMLMAYGIANDIPTFAVCRGEQVMGIVAGCDFIQDIPNYYKAGDAVYEDTHRMPVGVPNRTYARHDVDVLDNSKWLKDVAGGNLIQSVSSWHHQAIGDVSGTDITVVAKTTANGVDIVEGIELQKQTFCLGVQFHPENDCKLVLYDNKPADAKCDFDTCIGFFEMLVKYAG